MHQGLLAGEVCGTDLGVNELDQYQRHLEGRPVAAPIWRCEYDVTILFVVAIRHVRDFVDWFVLTFGLFAGLATAVIAARAGIRALDGRLPTRRTRLALIVMPIVGALVPLVVMTGDLRDSTLSYGFGAYALGAVLAAGASIFLGRARV